MGKRNDSSDDFMFFKTVTSGGCLVSALTIIGTVILIGMLIL